MKSIKVKEIPKRIVTRLSGKRKNEGTKEKSEFARRKEAVALKMAPAVRIMNRFSLLFHFILAFMINFVIEAVSRHSPFEAWDFLTGKPVVFLYNTFLIFITFSVVYLVRRRVFIRVMISAVWIGLGITNGYMLSKRVTPFNAPDLKNAMDFFTMIDSYLSPFEIVLVSIGVVLLIIWLIYMWRSGPKYSGRSHPVIGAAGVAFWLVAYLFVNNLALENRVISNYFGNIAFAFENYGFPYCFSSSLFDTGIDQPMDYSEESINEIMDGVEVNETADREEWPNIIIILLESLFDPYEVEFLEFSDDPLPTLRSLRENYSSGYFKVPSVGAGTANTEFEVLTGMNMRYFGPGEYPHKTILQKTTSESIAYSLKDLGYGTHAIHNNGGNFYDRANVFARLGFDTYTSKEFMNITNTTASGWAHDDVLVGAVLDALDSTPGQQDFIYCITVQSHGEYPEEEVLPNPTIKVTGAETEGKNNSWEYYANMIYDTDQMVADLIEEIEARGEPTVIAMFGDHLPTMGLAAEDVKSRYLFNTEYVIWDNIGLEKKDQNLASYQFAAEIMDQLDIHEGSIFQYHQSRRKTKNYLADLETLQYDMLYGEKYVYGDKVLEETDIQMGVRKVKVTNVTQNANGDIIIRGENFTKNSKADINGERIKVTYIAENLLQIKSEEYSDELQNRDEIVVNQVGSSNTIFSSSNPYYYFKPLDTYTTDELEETESEEEAQTEDITE